MSELVTTTSMAPAIPAGVMAVRATSAALDALHARRSAGGDSPFVVLNPGAAWPNKRWPPDRFGAVARWLRRVHGLSSVVTWGPGDETMAAAVVAGSAGAACLAPPTSIADLIAIVREAALMVSGDTGPMHLAAAVGTPIVGIYGPTDAARNGPWSVDDVTVLAAPRARKDRGGDSASGYQRASATGWGIGPVPVA